MGRNDAKLLRGITDLNAKGTPWPVFAVPKCEVRQVASGVIWDPRENATDRLAPAGAIGSSTTHRDPSATNYAFYLPLLTRTDGERLCLCCHKSEERERRDENRDAIILHGDGRLCSGGKRHTRCRAL